jgi:hypothetical protein
LAEYDISKQLPGQAETRDHQEMRLTGPATTARRSDAPVGETGVHQAALDGLDATVHHVARSNAARAGLGIVDRDLSDARRALLLVERVGAVGLEDAAVAVRGILTQADVAREQERRVELRQEPESEDYGRLG